MPLLPRGAPTLSTMVPHEKLQAEQAWEQPTAPAPVPRRTGITAKRVFGTIALVSLAWVYWHHPTPRFHACHSWLDELRDQVRWDAPECRIRGQSHDAACRTTYEQRNRAYEEAFLAEPSADEARAALQRYTAQHHIAGEKADYISTLRLIEEWSELLGMPRVRNASELIFDAGSSASREWLLQRESRSQKHAHPRVWADTYSIWLDQPVNSSLSLSSDGQEAWVANLAEDVLEEDESSAYGMPPFHGYSFSGRASGELVYVGDGHKADYELLASHGIDFHGKVVLVRYGGLFRGLKVRAAQEAGAVGVLIYSDLKEDDIVTEENGYKAYPDGPARQPSAVQRGSVQALSFYPGDPGTPGEPSYRNATRLPVDEADTLPKIPSLPISYTNAKRLLESLRGHGTPIAQVGSHLPGAIPGVEYWTGPSKEVAHMENQMDLKTRDIWNVYAVIPGYVDDQRVVLGNHRDAWTFGGVDPSSGTAVFHEVVKGFGALLRQGWKPMRTIVIASWDAEEYGLVGSTEFGEDYPEHILHNVAAYLNLDMAVGGSELSGSASPSLAGLLHDAGASVADPYRDGVLTFGEVDALGSGSDFTVFLQRIGIASADVSFRRKRGDAVYHYHSNFDSFHWVEKFGDPGFKRHEALAKVFGLMALRTAQSPFLPIDVVAYAKELEDYLAKVRKVADGRDADGLDAVADAIDRVVHRAKQLEKHIAHVGRRFRHLLAKEHGHRPSDELREAMRDVRHANLKLKAFESGFIDERGLPERTWYRHIGVAPGRWLGYGATTFPGLTEAYTIDGGKHAAFEIERLLDALHRIAEGLRW